MAEQSNSTQESVLEPDWIAQTTQSLNSQRRWPPGATWHPSTIRRVVVAEVVPHLPTEADLVEEDRRKCRRALAMRLNIGRLVGHPFPQGPLVLAVLRGTDRDELADTTAQLTEETHHLVGQLPRGWTTVSKGRLP